MTEFVIPTLIISGVYLATYIAWTAVDLIKKRRKNRLLQKLVVYGDTETRLLYIQNPLPDSSETLRERRRSLSQWLGSRATDGCRHTKSETQVYFDIDYYKYTVVHKCLLCGETQESEINRDELYDL